MQLRAGREQGVTLSYTRPAEEGVIPGVGFVIPPTHHLYVPTDSDIATIAEAFPGGDPERPSWAAIDARLHMEGHADRRRFTVPIIVEILKRRAGNGGVGMKAKAEGTSLAGPELGHGDPEAGALLALAGREFWPVTELPPGVGVDELRCLDDRGYVELQTVCMVRAGPLRDGPRTRQPSGWFSPIRQPQLAGRWDGLLGRAVNLVSAPCEVRLTERGLAELARLRRGCADSGTGGAETGSTGTPIHPAKPGQNVDSVRAQAEIYVRRNHDTWPGVNAMMRQCGCSKSVLYKAIKSSRYLSARKAEHEAKGGIGGNVRGATGHAFDDRAGHRENAAGASTPIANDEDFQALVDIAQSPEERSRLEEMPPLKRGDLLKTLQQIPEYSRLLAENASKRLPVATGRGAKPPKN